MQIKSSIKLMKIIRKDVKMTDTKEKERLEQLKNLKEWEDWQVDFMITRVKIALKERDKE